MREAIVNVHDHDGAALGLDGVVDVFREAGLDDVEVLSCEGFRGVVRAQVQERVDEDRLADLPTVTWYERIVDPGPGVAYLVEFDAEAGEDTIGACDDDLLLCGTLDVGDEGFTFGLAGPQESIRETIAKYQAAGARVGLELLRDYERHEQPLDALTDRQREVIETAFEMGYFDVPRRASTDEIAIELDLDDSTVSEHLQRAERNLLATVLDERV